MEESDFHTQAPIVTGRPKKKWPKILAVVLILLLLAGNAVWGYFYMQQNDKKKDEIASLNAKLSAAEKKAGSTSNLAQTKSPKETSQYREIPELGVKFPLNAETAKFSYSYQKLGDNAYVAYFSTKDLIEKSPIVNNEVSCSSGSGVIGTLQIVVPGSKVGLAGKPVEELVSQGSAKKVGDKYVVWTAPQSTCSSDKALQTMQTTSRNALEQAFKQLSLMNQ